MKWQQSNKLCVYGIPVRGEKSIVHVSDSCFKHCLFEHAKGGETYIHPSSSDKRGEK